jgi:hypothetical protein
LELLEIGPDGSHIREDIIIFDDPRHSIYPIHEVLAEMEFTVAVPLVHAHADAVMLPVTESQRLDNF